MGKTAKDIIYLALTFSTILAVIAIAGQVDGYVEKKQKEGHQWPNLILDQDAPPIDD